VYLGADLEAKDSSGASALYHASERGHEVTAHELVRHGANKEARTNAGDGPLIIASDRGHLAVVRLLLKAHGAHARSARLEATNANGASALSVAVQAERLEVVRELLARGANPNVRRNSGDSPLIDAADRGFAAIVRELLAHAGTDANARNANGVTPLMCAALRGRAEIVRLLLMRLEVDVDLLTVRRDRASPRASS
jgi:ankyrin repeat protein